MGDDCCRTAEGAICSQPPQWFQGDDCFNYPVFGALCIYGLIPAKINELAQFFLK